MRTDHAAAASPSGEHPTVIARRMLSPWWPAFELTLRSIQVPAKHRARPDMRSGKQASMHHTIRSAPHRKRPYALRSEALSGNEKAAHDDNRSQLCKLG